MAAEIGWLRLRLLAPNNETASYAGAYLSRPNRQSAGEKEMSWRFDLECTVAASPEQAW